MSANEFSDDSPHLGLGEKITLDSIPAEGITAEAVEIHNSTVRKIHGDTVTLRQSGASHVQAGQVSVQQGGVLAVNSGRLDLTQGGIAVAKADHVEVEGTLGIGVGESIQIRDGNAGIVLANQVSGSQMRSFLLLAGEVNGEVVAVLDTPRTILAGIVSGVAVGLVLMVGNLLTRRWKKG